MQTERSAGDMKRRIAMMRIGGAGMALTLPATVALTPRCAAAQARVPAPTIGLLSFFARPPSLLTDPLEAGLQQGLRELGLVEGQSIVVERRYADFRPDRLAAMTEELIRLKVDVIFASGQPARDAARKATGTIPIVTMGGSDPVREGWAQSLARPGANVTGIVFTFPELGSKRLELLKEAVPGLSRVAVLIDSIQVVDAKDVIRETEIGARRLGLQLTVHDIRAPQDLEAALERLRPDRAQAVLTLAMFPYRTRIAASVAAGGLPSMGESSQETDDGFLLMYGADIDDLGRRCVLQVGKILKGARPGEIPIERPTKFRLAINLKTAKALGITVAQSLLLRADEVIQ